MSTSTPQSFQVSFHLLNFSGICKIMHIAVEKLVFEEHFTDFMFRSQHATPLAMQSQTFALHSGLSGQTQSVLCVFCSKVHSRMHSRRGNKNSARGGPLLSSSQVLESRERLCWNDHIGNSLCDCDCVCLWLCVCVCSVVTWSYLKMCSCVWEMPTQVTIFFFISNLQQAMTCN